MPKVVKKTGTAPAAPAPAPAAEEKAPRLKLSDLPPAEKQTMAEALIDEIYGENDLDQKEKSKRRQRLRNIDREWRTTYANYIETTYPPPPVEEEPAPAAKPAPAKAPAKPAAPAPTKKVVGKK